MNNVRSMQTLDLLYDAHTASELPLPSELTALYGRLGFASHSGRPYVISNFVSTMDGVVSLDVPGMGAGDIISGYNQHDSMVMGLLRAAADIVMIGAGTLSASPQHIWTPGHVFPACAESYSVLRDRMGKPPTPLIVIVTAHGNVDVSLPLFRSGDVAVLIVTTQTGAGRFKRKELPESVRIIAGTGSSVLKAREILEAVATVCPRCDTILIEGGPQLLGDFFAERRLDEVFLTLAPQVAGRMSPVERLGMVAGKVFAPEDPVWGKLLSVKRGGSHLFLRYAFDSISGV